jgi:hypothetical protein
MLGCKSGAGSVASARSLASSALLSFEPLHVVNDCLDWAASLDGSQQFCEFTVNARKLFSPRGVRPSPCSVWSFVAMAILRPIELPAMPAAHTEVGLTKICVNIERN